MQSSSSGWNTAGNEWPAGPLVPVNAAGCGFGGCSMKGYLCAGCGARKKMSGDAGVLGRSLRWELTLGE